MPGTGNQQRALTKVASTLYRVIDSYVLQFQAPGSSLSIPLDRLGSEGYHMHHSAWEHNPGLDWTLM